MNEEWTEIKNKFDTAAFVTHNNYLAFTREHSKNLELTCNRNIRTQIALPDSATQKILLYKLTKENIIAERRNIENYPEYSIVCSSWIPVKAYYLFFNLITLFEYLITADTTFLDTTHAKLHKQLLTLLSEGEIAFNSDFFNQVVTLKEADNWKMPSHTHVKSSFYNPRTRFKKIIRKIKDYKKEDFKRRENVKSLRSPRKERFLKQKANLCELFYWYRIKANYRDMEFVEIDVSVEDFYEFYNNYYNLIMNFDTALSAAIVNLAQKRGCETIFNQK